MDATVLHPLFCSTNRFANDFFNRAANCFNSLPVHVINSPTINSFKNALCSIDLSDFIKCTYLKLDIRSMQNAGIYHIAAQMTA